MHIPGIVSWAPPAARCWLGMSLNLAGSIRDVSDHAWSLTSRCIWWMHTTSHSPGRFMVCDYRGLSFCNMIQTAFSAKCSWRWLGNATLLLIGCHDIVAGKWQRHQGYQIKHICANKVSFHLYKEVTMRQSAMPSDKHLFVYVTYWYLGYLFVIRKCTLSVLMVNRQWKQTQSIFKKNSQQSTKSTKTVGSPPLLFLFLLSLPLSFPPPPPRLSLSLSPTSLTPFISKDIRCHERHLIRHTAHEQAFW